jgi:hypothetical protein
VAIKTTQVTLHMKTRSQGKTQVDAAARVGISERTAQRLDAGEHATKEPTKPRPYKTRTDPLVAVWENELAPML